MAYKITCPQDTPALTLGEAERHPPPRFFASQSLASTVRLPFSTKTRTLRRVSAHPQKNGAFTALLARHFGALGYLLRVVLPTILRTGRRPVIFSRYTGMGDIICTIPAAQELMKRHPGAPFIYNCHPDFAAVPRLAGLTEHVTTFLNVNLVGHWYRGLLGGFYHFAHGDDTPGKSAQAPMVQEFCRQFQVPETTEHPRLTSSPATQARVRQRLAHKQLYADALVLIHPGPSWTVKEWPTEHWTRLVAELRAKGFTHIAQLGVGRYMNFGKVTVANIPGTVSLLDELSIEECVAAIGMAKLFIGIDSGLLHLAACTRTPSVSVWGPTNPNLFYATPQNHFEISSAPCRGCEHQRPRGHWISGCPNDLVCMKEIPVSAVLAACLQRLQIT